MYSWASATTPPGGRRSLSRGSFPWAKKGIIPREKRVESSISGLSGVSKQGAWRRNRFWRGVGRWISPSHLEVGDADDASFHGRSAEIPFM
jgi:hypothetical protein